MNEDIQAVLEALLFTAEEPLSLQDLAGVLSLSKNETKKQLEVINREYQENYHGIELKEYDNSYIFASKPEFADYIEKLHQASAKNKLSQAALETLAIIAYKQPVTRTEIEDIRGVNVEKTLMTLSKYNLVQELGRKDTIGNPIVYGTTGEFLIQFDLTDLSQLPDFEQIEDVVQFTESMAEAAVTAEDNT